MPCSTSRATTSGTSATRRSPAAVSRGTPTRIGAKPIRRGGGAALLRPPVEAPFGRIRAGSAAAAAPPTARATAARPGPRLRSMEHMIVSVGLGLLFALVFLESMGLPLPGETAVIAASVLASTGKFPLWQVIV